MLYVASTVTATAQLSAIKCDFIQSEVDAVIVNKLSRIEVLALDAERTELQVVLEIPIWSSIVALAAIKLPGDATSSLIVLTSSMQLFSIKYQLSTPHIITTSSVSILEEYGRLAEYQSVLIHPNSECIIVHAYSGLLRVIPLSTPRTPRKGRAVRKDSDVTTSEPFSLNLSAGYNVRLPSLNVTSIAFILQNLEVSAPAIALLNCDHLGQRRLESYEIDLKEKELSKGPIDEIVLSDPGSELLIPVHSPNTESGLIIAGETSLVWIGAASKQSLVQKGKRKANGSTEVSCNIPVGMIQAWSAYPGVPDTFLIGDIFGKLSAIKLKRSESGKVINVLVVDLGDTSSPTSIVPLTRDLVYLSSKFADSQLIRTPDLNINASDAVTQTSDIQLEASFSNLAPIFDCCVLSDDGGLSQVVTCSGAYKGGSLRIIRQGIGLRGMASLAIAGVQRVWTLKRSTKYGMELSCGVKDPDLINLLSILLPSHHLRLQDLIVLSYFDRTQVLSLRKNESGDEELEEMEIPEFINSKPTLLAVNVGSLLLQVSADHVGFWDPSSGKSGQWEPEPGEKITLAASAGPHVLLALRGGKVILLQESENSLVAQSSISFEHEVACLHVSHVNSKYVAAIALWTVQTISLVDVPSLSTLTNFKLDTSFLIRSVLINSTKPDLVHLFAGLGDGTLITYVLDLNTWEPVLGSDKRVTLGNKPIVMAAFSAKNARNVFVSSDRPTVISVSGDKLVFSSVNLKDVNAICAFDSEDYPNSLIFATLDGLEIGSIEDIQRVDIRSVPLEDDEPRRIAHDSLTKVFGVVCLRRDIDRTTGRQRTQGTIKVFNDQTFEELANILLEEGEEGQSIEVHRSGNVSSFVIGTAVIRAEEAEPTTGRLLCIRASNEGIYMVQKTSTIQGCPYALAPLSEEKMAAAINSEVIIYDVHEEEGFIPIARWGGGFISYTLQACAGNTLLVGDAMRSITLLQLKTEPIRLEEIAREHSVHYMSATAALGDGGEYIGAETDLNLFTVQKEDVATMPSQIPGVSLLPRGEFHLGEMVVRFCEGSIKQKLGDNAAFATPRLVFATSAGSLGVIVQLNAAASKLLSDIERNMRYIIPGIGGLQQESWRSFKSERRSAPSTGFVDGNFVEMLTDLDAAQLKQVLAGHSEHELLAESSEVVLKLVEELARLH